jgi:hypothetical protein
MMWEKRMMNRILVVKSLWGLNKTLVVKSPVMKSPEGSFIYSVLDQDKMIESKIMLKGRTRPEMSPTTWARSGPT